MADKTLSLAEFGASIKAKYPAYKDVPDDEIGTRMLDKYPVYRERVATFTTSAEEPPESFGRQAGRAVLNSLPGIGGLVGGALSTPETLGTGTIAGVALGAAAGKGLRDLLAEGFGLEQPTTPEVKAVNIALEGGTTAALSALLPGIVEAAKNPRATIGELVELIPKRWRPVVPDVMKKAPAQMILQRPAWQNVQKAAAEATESPATRTTGTSWTPAPMPTPRAAPLDGVPAEAEAMNAPKVPAPVPQEPHMATPEPVAAPTKSPSQTLNEIAIAARRAKVKLTLADYDALTPTVQSGKMSAAEALSKHLESTAAPKSAIEQLSESSSFSALPSDAERTFPPNKSGLPTKPPTARKAVGKVSDLSEMPQSPDKTSVEPQSVKDFRDIAQQGRIHSATGKFTKAEEAAKTPISSGETAGYSQSDIAKFFLERRGGKEDIAAYDYVKALQMEGRPISANLWDEVVTKKPKGYVKSGDRYVPNPTATKARGKIADLADMPVTKAEPVQAAAPVPETEPTPAPAPIATAGKISDLAAPEATPAAPAKKVRVPKAKVDAPAEAAAQVKQQVKRVVDVEGVKSGSEVQRRVIGTLQNELESASEAAGFKSLEFRPGKAYGGREGVVVVDGEPLARVDRYGKMTWLDDTPSYTTAQGKYVQSVPSERGQIGFNNTRGEMTPSEVAREAQNQVATALAKYKGAGQIVIDIPGDGTFTIERNPHAIQAVIKRIAAAPGGTWGGVGSVKNAPPVVGPQIPKATW